VQRHDAVLVALAVHHEAGGLGRVVAHIGPHHLAAAEAAVGEQREDGAVSRLALAGHDLLDLAPVEHPWQAALAAGHRDADHGAAREIAALHEPAGEAVQLDEAAAHRVDAPAAGGHVGLVVADEGGGEAAESGPLHTGPLTLPSPLRGEGSGAAAEELQEQAEVAPIGLDRHRAESLLHRAVLEEARVQGGQRHGAAGA
jgi:hypothetical protein